MKIIYLTWGETPRLAGVYGSQVIGQIKAIEQELGNSEFTLISGVPIIFSGLINEKTAYISELQKVKAELGNINFKLLPIFAPQTCFYTKRPGFFAFHGFSHRILSRIVERENPNIIHCRSYHSAFAALSVREKKDLSYKIIFDARGLWPEEAVLKKKVSVDSPDYCFIKMIESKLLQRSDLTISVSDTMNDHFQSLKVKRGEVIYLSANIAELSKPVEAQRVHNRSAYSNKEIKQFIYVGALSDKTWHKPRKLIELFKVIKQSVEHAHLLIVTQSNHKDLMPYLDDLSPQDYELHRANNVTELSNFLRKAHVGLLSYFTPKSEIEKRIANTVIGTKTAEYLASGIPIIVNRDCKGASRIVEQCNVGISYDPDNLEEAINPESISFLLSDSLELSQRCIKLAEESFGYKSNAKKYANFYHQLSPC